MRIYYLPFDVDTITAPRTLIYIVNAADKTLRVIESTFATTDNATNQQLKASWCRYTSGTIGSITATTGTAKKADPGDAAASFTWKYDVTANDVTWESFGAGYTGLASVGGHVFMPTHGKPTVSGQGAIALRILAPATFTGSKFSGIVVVGEEG